MNDSISGLFRRPGIKHLPKRIATFAIASGFVFSGATDYATLPSVQSQHQMTENTEVIIEQINQSQTSAQTKVLNQALEIEPLANVSAAIYANDTKEENQTYLLADTYAEFFDNFAKQLQEILESFDYEKALDFDGQANQQKPLSSKTENSNAENKTTAESKTTVENKNTSANNKKPAENKESIQTTEALSPTRPPEPSSRPEVVEKEASQKAYPLSIPTISQKTIPQGIEFDKNGIPLNYSRVIEGKASAYTNDPITATGTRPVPGTVAVNPKNIPYGTKLWIVSADGKYTYGYAVAEDTGGFIYWNNGPVVDLFMNTSSECTSFGVRNVKMYVLS